MGVPDVCAGQGLPPGQLAERHPLGGPQSHELGVPDRVDQRQQQAAVGCTDRPVEELTQVLHTHRVLEESVRVLMLVCDFFSPKKVCGKGTL